MKKMLACSCLFLMTAASGWADLPGKAAPARPYLSKGSTPTAKAALGTTQIECTLAPTESFSHRSRPHTPVYDSTSSTNWSGYAALSNTAHPANRVVNAVSASWTVPTVSAASGDTYSAIWVGIDGFLPSSPSVEQIGTSHDWSNGAQVNYAWFEMYPNPSYAINGFPLNAGDEISADVTYIGNNTFRMTIVNVTQGVHFTVPVSHTRSATAKRSSAEWIVEAPYSGEILPLANFGTVGLTNCTAQFSQVNGGINNIRWADIGIQMITTGHALKAQTSSLGSNGESFSVTWEHE